MGAVVEGPHLFGAPAGGQFSTRLLVPPDGPRFRKFGPQEFRLDDGIAIALSALTFCRRPDQMPHERRGPRQQQALELFLDESIGAAHAFVVAQML